MAVVKIIEVVSTSPDGFQDAVQRAVQECCRTVRNVVGVEVVGWTCNVENGKVVEYKADCKIAFVVEAECC